MGVRASHLHCVNCGSTDRLAIDNGLVHEGLIYCEVCAALCKIPCPSPSPARGAPDQPPRTQRRYARHSGPCLSCGYGHPRARNLCANCYTRAKVRGVRDDYPACGNRPVPYLPEPPDHPAIPTGLISPAMLGIRPEQHAVIPGYDWAAVALEAEDYASRWLARRGAAAD